MNTRKTLETLEKSLKTLFPAPDEVFLKQLEGDLLTRSIHNQDTRGAERPSRQGYEERTFPSLKRRRWVHLALGLTLLAAVTVLVIGPAQVLAQLQHWVGYVPGIGFTELADAYALPEPVVASRDGVTLHIEQVLAQPERTVVILSVEGLDIYEQNPFHNNSFLLLPDGTTYPPMSRMLDWDKMVFEFGPLPAGFSEVRLVWSDNFMRDWHQEDPEEAWSIPLALVPVKDIEAASLPRSYPPEGASDTAHEITIRVLAVSQDEERTALQLEMQWPVKLRGADSYWPCCGITLTDETGREYQGRKPIDFDTMGVPRNTIYPEGPGTASFYSIEDALVFQPGPSDPQQLTLIIERVLTWLWINKEVDFTLDVGPSPQVGDSWPLDVPFEVGGAEARINGARVVEVENDSDKGPDRILALEFSLDALPEDAEAEIIQMNLYRQPQRGYSIAGSVEDPVTGIFILRVPLMDPRGKVQTGEIHVRGGMAQVVLIGPWQISWEVPSGQH